MSIFYHFLLTMRESKNTIRNLETLRHQVIGRSNKEVKECIKLLNARAVSLEQLKALIMKDGFRCLFRILSPLNEVQSSVF